MRAITSALLSNVFTGYNTAFRSGFAGTDPIWAKIATKVPSSAASEEYSWLGAWPRLREWLGDRVVKQLAAEKYTVANKTFESTIAVPRENIEDDQIGIFTPMFTEMGKATAQFPDELVFALLAAGFVSKCYDGQPFFDTNHPTKTVDANGNAVDAVASNMQAGAQTPWFLLDTSRALKPLIYQERRPFDFTGLTDPSDPNVFNRKEYVYGVDGRANAGYGFWQMAFGSKLDLTSANYEAARAAMMALRDDAGRPLGIKPNLLVVPGTLEGKGRRLLSRQTTDAGADNEWYGSAELLVAPLL